MLTQNAPKVRRADSRSSKAAEAVSELASQLEFASSALTVFFHSPAFESADLRLALAPYLEETNLIGCSSAGEIGSHGYQSNSISAFSLPAGDFTASVQSFQELGNFSVDRAHQIVADAKADLFRQGVDPDDHNCFALLLVDGLSAAEEPLAFKIQEALQQIPLIGGSAADGLSFGQTKVYSQGKFKSDAAVLAIVHSLRPWEVFKEQHINPTETKLVVTEADPDQRIIYEFNGEPAAQELARAIGQPGPESLTSAILAKHPLMIKLGGSWYIRSAHSVIEKNALKLFCAVEDGLVLSLGESEDLPASLEKTLGQISERLGGIQLTIACDCILRRLELENCQSLSRASKALARHHAVGFSTYGEQFGSAHVNQTLTGIAIG